VVSGLERLADTRTVRGEDLSNILEPLAERRRHDKARLLELRFRLKEQVTREEWARIFPSTGSP